MNVLLVEDDAVVRWMVTEVLQEAGFEVTEHASAEDALAATQDDSAPSVLVTDVRLGRTNGFKLGETARQRWPGLPIVYISGLDPAYYRDRLDERATAVQKPFAVRRLVDAVQQVLAN